MKSFYCLPLSYREKGKREWGNEREIKELEKEKSKRKGEYLFLMMVEIMF